jgi:hypothetical protein
MSSICMLIRSTGFQRPSSNLPLPSDHNTTTADSGPHSANITPPPYVLRCCSTAPLSSRTSVIEILMRRAGSRDQAEAAHGYARDLTGVISSMDS